MHDSVNRLREISTEAAAKRAANRAASASCGIRDNRPVAVQLRRLQDAVNRSPQSRRCAKLSALVGSARNPVQLLKKFANLDAALQFVRANPRTSAHADVNKYVNAMKRTFGGKKKYDDNDIELLTEAATAVHFQAPETTGTARITVERERKLLSSLGWKHIWCGDVSSKGRPAGFHWKGKQDEAFCTTSGSKTDENDGFYRQAVTFRRGTRIGSRIDGKAVKHLEKPDHSSFFPDAWTEQEVKDAIELRNSSNEITTAKGLGTRLRKSGDTIYPDLD